MWHLKAPKISMNSALIPQYRPCLKHLLALRDTRPVGSTKEVHCFVVKVKASTAPQKQQLIWQSKCLTRPTQAKGVRAHCSQDSVFEAFSSYNIATM